MAVEVFLQVTTLISLFIGAEGWRCAKYKHYFSQQPDYIDCVWDCCGNSFNRHCCAPIGIIVGISIVCAVFVAALAVLLACWWQRRRSRYAAQPRLFHNRKHSHYPVAPTSVTRPAPLMPYRGGTEREGMMYKPPQGQGNRPPPTSAYRPRPGPERYDDHEKKVPPTDFYEPRGPAPPRGPEPPRGPPREQGYRQGPPRPGTAQRSGPPPPRPPVQEYFD